MQFEMPIYVTRQETCVASSRIKPYGSRVRICPEAERKKAAFSFLRASEEKESK